MYYFFAFFALVVLWTYARMTPEEYVQARQAVARRRRQQFAEDMRAKERRRQEFAVAAHAEARRLRPLTQFRV